MKWQSVYLFGRLDETKAARLDAISHRRKHPKGTLLFMEGETPKELLLVTAGVVRVYKVDEKGTEITLHHFGPGSLVAEMAALEKIPFPASAAAETDVELIGVALEPFEQEFLNDPAVARSIIRSLCFKVKGLERALSRAITPSALQRTVRFIRENPELFTTLKQREIASLLGLAPETLSRVLRKLKDQGVVGRNGSEFVLLDPAKLALFTDA
ncbi:MAG: Crp/Fnr family transcriptional regulator [Campylobacterales bacterium]